MKSSVIRTLIFGCLLAASTGVLAQSDSTLFHRVDSLNALAEATRTTEFDSTVFHANQALELANGIHYATGIAHANFHLGVVHHKFSFFDEAIAYLETASSMYSELGEEPGLAKSENSLGILYKAVGDYEGALEHYYASVRIKERLGDQKGQANTLNNIGIIHMMQKNYDKALEIYEQSLAIKRELGNEKSMAVTYSNIGNVYMDQENFEKALEYQMMSLEILERLQDLNRLPLSLINMGLIHLGLEQHDKAMEYFSRSLSISRQTGHKIHLQYSLNGVGTVHLAQKRPEKVIPLAKEALGIAIEVGAKAEERESHELLAQAYKDMGDYRRAYGHYNEYVWLKDSLVNAHNLQQMAELEVKFDKENKERELQVKATRLEQQEAEKSSEEAELKTREAEADQQKTYNNFLISVGVIIVVLSYFLFNWYRLRQANKQSLLQTKQVEIEQRLLRAQMNPHFIFNSLNSIQSFISENEGESAEKYLSKFARLMENILENSKRAYVTLESEIDTLQLYLELERLRFGNKFDFKITVDEKIKAEDWAIPPMLAQPYIENAILHGMAHKETKGHILVDFKLAGEVIICTVEDDGVGRKKAMEIKRQTGSTHVSRGMQVTKDRIDLLNQQGGSDIQVRIIDKDQKDSTGTLVNLTIPFIAA